MRLFQNHRWKPLETAGAGAGGWRPEAAGEGEEVLDVPGGGGSAQPRTPPAAGWDGEGTGLPGASLGAASAQGLSPQPPREHLEPPRERGRLRRRRVGTVRRPQRRRAQGPDRAMSWPGLSAAARAPAGSGELEGAAPGRQDSCLASPPSPKRLPTRRKRRLRTIPVPTGGPSRARRRVRGCQPLPCCGTTTGQSPARVLGGFFFFGGGAGVGWGTPCPQQRGTHRC